MYLIYSIWPINYKEQLKKLNLPSTCHPIAFFHPSCDGGGGGERVLWMGIQSLQKKYPEKYFIIYTKASVKMNKILEIVKGQFGVNLLQDKIVFVPLKSWKFLESNSYPKFTLILSSLGSLIPAFEAMQILKPKILIESVGFAFIYPLAKLFGSKVIAYVHYPTISSDMLGRVEQRVAAFNNNTIVANSNILSSIKLVYYRGFSLLYGFAGSFSDVVMVNSSWTLNHINQIWSIQNKTKIVYPPCDTSNLLEFSLEGRKRIILSVSQFRPEKNHKLQIQIIENLFKKHPNFKSGPNAVKLVLLGSVRNAEDKSRVDELYKMIELLDLKVFSNTY